MKNKTKVMLLKAPLIILMVASFLGSIVAAYQGIEGIDWTSPIVLGIILALYIVGYYVGREEE